MAVASLFVDLLTPAVGLALTPIAIMGGILLLASSRPVANDLAFTLPFVVLYGLSSVAVIVVAGMSDDALVGERTKDMTALVISVLLLGLGVGTWLHTRRARRRDERKQGMLARVAAG